MYVGVMSGTSMDAVDIACVGFTDERPTLQCATSVTWPDDLVRRVRDYAGGSTLDAAQAARLDADVGRFLAESINAFVAANGLDRTAIRAIGCHGQTVAHDPDGTPPVTAQIGDANVVAEATGITTVNDFRRRDMAAGGQGAPLAPAFHAAVLRARDEHRVVLNLGGIANVTILPAGDGAVTGFDTGPASCLMDLWMRRQRGKPFDDAGDWAATGRVVPRLLAALLDDRYFALPAPKSTGTQYFSPAWLDNALAATPTIAAQDVQATLLALTRDSVADAIDSYAPATERVLVCGGGVHNRQLLRELATTLQRPVESTAQYGIDPDWMEAMAFAWLARRTLDGLPGNLPPVTGAAGERVLGAIHPA